MKRKFVQHSPTIETKSCLRKENGLREKIPERLNLCLQRTKGKLMKKSEKAELDKGKMRVFVV